ncbi:hypothetical protein BC829DRAFT_381149 [Chytridium lagenaria]|nr:hypothetical protein BC829DRAFT_381149 [Chytridium lagenaria]
MFGCIVAGRLVQTNLQQVDATKYVFELTDAKSINHIVVFLLGQPFPAGYAATVHFLWPNVNAPPTWQLLGMLSNEKPSAVFKLSGRKDMGSSQNDLMMDDGEMPVTANLGISIEPQETVFAAVQGLQMGKEMGSSELVLRSSTNVGKADVAAKILLLLSFATNLPPNGISLMGLDLTSTYIPLKTLLDWYNNFQRKLKMDPSGGFLFKTDA